MLAGRSVALAADCVVGASFDDDCLVLEPDRPYAMGNKPMAIELPAIIEVPPTLAYDRYGIDGDSW